MRLMKQGRLPEALEVADALLADHPEVAMSHRAKGECLFKMERYEEAIPCFQQADDLGGPGTEEVLIFKAFCLHNLGRSAEAEQELKRLIKKTHHPTVSAKADEVLAAFRAKR